MTDDHDTAVAGPQLRGQELKTTSVEMIGRFIEQQKVVVSTEKTCQTYAMALANRQFRERNRHVRFCIERFESDLYPPLGVPGIQHLGVLQRNRIPLGRRLCSIGERIAGGLQVRQRRKGFGDRLRDNLPYGALVGDIHLLLGHTDRPDTLHRAAIRHERTGQHLEERRFSTTVLPDDRNT